MSFCLKNEQRFVLALRSEFKDPDEHFVGLSGPFEFENTARELALRLIGNTATHCQILTLDQMVQYANNEEYRTAPIRFAIVRLLDRMGIAWKTESVNG